MQKIQLSKRKVQKFAWSTDHAVVEDDKAIKAFSTEYAFIGRELEATASAILQEALEDVLVRPMSQRLEGVMDVSHVTAFHVCAVATETPIGTLYLDYVIGDEPEHFTGGFTVGDQWIERHFCAARLEVYMDVDGAEGAQPVSVHNHYYGVSVLGLLGMMLIDLVGDDPVFYEPELWGDHADG